MDIFTITEYDVITGLEITREMTPEEKAQHLQDIADETPSPD
jgi:hypothetical protein